MNQSISNSLIAADEADDILQYLALGILKTREIKMKSQPDYNVIELYKWMPDNQKLVCSAGRRAHTEFEQTPSYAIVDKSVLVTVTSALRRFGYCAIVSMKEAYTVRIYSSARFD